MKDHSGMDKNIFAKAIETIRKGNKFLVVSHVNPEGDAVGSLLGMALALRAAGKDVTAYLEDQVPTAFRFLPGAGTVVHSLEGTGQFDITIAVDCGQKDRLGRDFMALIDPGIIINLDHHITNTGFGDINIVMAEASAAGEVIYDLLKAASMEITKDVAVNLYVAIHTDTGSFRYSSSTPESFMKAGELVRLGAEPWQVAMQVYENHPAKKYKLLGMVLGTLDIVELYGRQNPVNIATLVITFDMLKKAGADKDLADGFVNYARGIEGVEAGLLFREARSGEYKISMRSKGKINVAVVAGMFGGGGHSNAAGCTIRGTLDEVKERLVGALRDSLAAGRQVKENAPS